jgi:hypothetical protein
VTRRKFRQKWQGNVKYCSKYPIYIYIYFYDTKLSCHHRNCNAGLPLTAATFNSTAAVYSISCQRTGQHIITGGKPQYFFHMQHLFMVTADKGTIPFETMKLTITLDTSLFFICGSFNNALCCSYYETSNYRVTSK